MSARQKAADQARIRQICRHVAGELDLQLTSDELRRWIQFAYEHERYREAIRLFSGVHESDVNEALYRWTRKIVHVCRMRAGRSAEDAQARLL